MSTEVKQAEFVADKQRCSSDAQARKLANLKPFPKGVSGNPKGRPKSITLSEALRRVLSETMPDAPETTYAEQIARVLCTEAAKGNVTAAREIADRTEGKARQTLTLSVDRRDQIEREIERIIDEAEALGEPVTREEAIASLALHYPEASQLIQ